MTNVPAKQHLTLMDMINQRKEEVGKLVPPGVSLDAFTRVLANAVLKDSNLNRLDPRLVFLEVSKAAQDGLMLDGREAALVSYGGKVTYIPMTLGIRKRALQSGHIKALFSNVVYEEEVTQGRFKYLPVSDEPIYHEPLLGGNIGNPVAVYSLAVLSDGTKSVELMRLDEVNAIRDRSRASGGPWKTDWSEMAKKTVFRRHSKSLPLGDTFRGVFERIDDLYDLNKPKVSAADKLTVAEPVARIAHAKEDVPENDDFPDDIPPPGKDDVF